MFKEEDFPPLPLEEDSGGEEVSVPLDAAAPPASPVLPSVDEASPPGVAVPSDVLPDPVADPAAPNDLPGALCASSALSSSSSSAPAPGPAPSPCVSSVMGAGVAVPPPAVCSPVPPVVEAAAAVLHRAAVHPAGGAPVSGSASGLDDVRPEPKRSQLSFSAWADVGYFSDCGSMGVEEDLDAAMSTELVVAEVHVPAGTGARVSAVPSVPSPPGGSPQGGVVASAARYGMDTGPRSGLVVTLRKDARRKVPVAAGAPVVVPSVRLTSVRVSTGDLEDVLPASVMPPDH
ncbi:uncharacterized protein [Procambarus clarkii]|uniref:uncharacterized protein n=1 Tax=Procambarus clarkii TaxID=6728 RepID=UPI0037424D15